MPISGPFIDTFGRAHTTAIDVYDFVRQRLLSSLLWRQRLPLSGVASPLSGDELLSRYCELFQQLAGDLAKTMRDERFVRDFLEQWGFEPSRITR